ncbi:MAG: hypothetical protein KC493_02430 [Bacteriovoracaceae bacterium]|nr:hypothetical protein [Bacteriovoracaceae bacterium]
MKQNKIQIIILGVTLTLIVIFTVNHFNKTEQSNSKNPFLSVNQGDSIERAQVESSIDPGSLYPSDYVVGKFKKNIMKFKDFPTSAKFDLYRIKQDAYMRSLIALKETFIIMYNYVDSKMGYPQILPNIAQLLAITPPTEEYVEKYYEKVKKTYPIKNKNAALIQLTQDITIDWHSKAFFKRLKQLEDDELFKIYILPPKHPELSFVDKKDIATLGNKIDAKYTLEIFTNYGCKRCVPLNLQVSNLFKVLKDDLLIKQFIISPPPPPASTQRDLLEDNIGHYMTCALKEDADTYWKLHVDIIQDKELLSQMSKNNDESELLISELFKKHLSSSSHESWELCTQNKREKKTNNSLSRLLVTMMGIKIQPTYYLNGRYLEVINGNLLTSIKEALRNPNWK